MLLCQYLRCVLVVNEELEGNEDSLSEELNTTRVTDSTGKNFNVSNRFVITLMILHRKGNKSSWTSLKRAGNSL